MNNRECFYFIGRCLTLGFGEQTDSDIIREIKQDKIDWEKFVFIASNHMVLSLLYKKFKDNDILEIVPEEIAEHLEMIYNLNLSRNEEILKQIKSINTLLNERGIKPIFLKGSAYLLNGLFEDYGDRIMSDIDFLVSDIDFLKTVEILKSVGYESGKPFYEDELVICKHYPPLVKEGLPVEVEVHRIPVDIEFSKNFNYSIIETEKREVEGFPGYFIPSDKHLIISNFFHSFMARDINLISNISLRNFYDLYKLSEKENIEEVFSKLKRYSGKALLYADYMKYTLGLSNGEDLSSSSRRFIRGADNPLMSKMFFRYLRVLKSTLSRSLAIYKFYFSNIFSSKPIRKYILRRIFDLEWYKRRLGRFLRGFKINSGLLKH
jgi:hypothetical protein